jgi:hypothetical protein
MRLTPRNWSDFQHYKNRCPPWIRLHRKLLDNKDFQRLPVESRALAPMLWLLASESVDGVIDATLDDLAFRLRSSEPEITLALRPLVEKGFFSMEQDASSVLATRRQSAEPETEAERETEREAEAQFGQAAAAAKPKRAGKPKAEPPASSLVWVAYATAYRDRYGVEPVRNAPVNAQLAQVVGRIPASEAPLIAAWYVGLDDRFYVAAGHSTALLLRDCEALRTRWVTNRQRPFLNEQPPQTTAESAHQRGQRQRMSEFAPGVAAEAPGMQREIIDVTANVLG